MSALDLAQRPWRRAALLLAIVPLAAIGSVDRVQRMNAAERCVYTAQLAVIGYHYFLEGKTRGEVPVRWHGDETQNEMNFVNVILDETFLAAERDRREHPQAAVSEQAFGDRAYRACMSAVRS